MDKFFTFSLGDLALIITLLGAAYRIQRFALGVQKSLDLFAIEHEILLADFCKRNNIRLQDLPTRFNRRGA